MTDSAQLQQKAAARDKKRFVRMTVDGASCICRADETRDILTGLPIDGATYADVWMTEDEYEALPEFTGW